MEKWGTGETYSPTHTRFASDLLVDCRTDLLRISADLDQHREDEDALLALADITEDLHALRASRRLNRAEHFGALKAIAAGDRTRIVAAAVYAQWISDSIRWEAARCEKEIQAVLEAFADADDLTLIRHATPLAREVIAPGDPPPPPTRLESADTLPERARSQLDSIQQWAGQAAWAIGLSDTPTMKALCQHVATFRAWLLST